MPTLRCHTSWAALALVLCATPSSARAQGWKEIATGVEYLAETRAGPNRVYVLRVDLCAPGVRMRATAPGEGPRTVSSFGKLVGGFAAINGDWPAKDGTLPLPAGSPRGLSVGDGKHFPGTEDPPYYGFFAFGHNAAKHSDDAEALGAPGMLFFLAYQDVVSGQPTLVWNGQARHNPNAHCGVRNPRTSVGIDATGTKLLLAVVDGRTSASVGMTCNELAAFMISVGAHSAELQDGGGSSTMWLSTSGVVNKPSDGAERTLVNHWAVIANGQGPPRSCATRKPLAASSGVRRAVSSAAMAAWKLDAKDVFLMSDATLKTYPQGPAWPAKPPVLLKGTGPAIYLEEGPAKRHVPSPYAMKTWRLTAVAITSTKDAQLGAMPDGATLTPTPVLVTSDGKTTYLIDRAPPAVAAPDAGVTPVADGGTSPTPTDGAGVPAVDAGPGHDGSAVIGDGPVGGDRGTVTPVEGGGCALGGQSRGALVGACLLALVLLLRRRRRA